MPWHIYIYICPCVFWRTETSTMVMVTCSLEGMAWTDAMTSGKHSCDDNILLLSTLHYCSWECFGKEGWTWDGVRRGWDLPFFIFLNFPLLFWLSTECNIFILATLNELVRGRKNLPTSSRHALTAVHAADGSGHQHNKNLKSHLKPLSFLSSLIMHE